MLACPACWVTAAALHYRNCGFIPLCAEPLLDSIAHVLLVTLSPHVAVLAFAAGDEVRRRS